MATYSVFYKGFYYEFDQWGNEFIDAASAIEALGVFLKAHGIQRRPRLDRQYKWWEGDWLMTYRGINILDENNRQECSECHGKGTVPTRKPVIARPNV